MSLRKEHFVLIGSVAVLGLLGWSVVKGRTPPRVSGSRGAAKVEFEHYPAPDPQIVLAAPRKLDDLDRDLFSQPTDTHPLPPLVTVEPPMPTLTALRPLTSYTVSPPFFGRLLRADPTPTVPPVAKLFNTGAEGETPDDTVAESDEPSNLALLNQATPAGEIETPEQHAAKLESWKKLYDWIRITEGEPLFGQIRNPDRYGLGARTGEAVLFVEVLPQTGVERFAGQKPVPYERARVLQFAFADTASNRIQLRRREFVAPIGASRYADLLAFADECVAARLDAREALSVAEDMYNLAVATEPDDPTPQLGLAHCYEAGFELEKAFDVYTRLIAAKGVHPEVRVGLAQLEAKLRLFGRAETHFKEAFAQGRSNWSVLWPYGRFQLDHAHYDDALALLSEAYRNEPSEPPQARTRAAIRTELGGALIALAHIDDAQDKFEKALQAEANDSRALAGKLSSAYYSKKAPDAASSASKGNDEGFELLMARALLDMQAKNWGSARDQLMLAAAADPLRAPRAWAALSWLAEVTGYAENAVRFIEQAVEGDPSDPWIRYQHGRLLAARDDVQGAHDEFVAALDLQLDFVDTVIALGALAHRSGAYEDAERYLERALFLDNTRAEIHALRGWNFIELNDLASARECFDAALSNDKMQPLARAGQAWTTYLASDSEKAIPLFAELNDGRRSLPETDPYRVYALSQIDRINDHESKVVWSDRFERRKLINTNSWEVEEATGPTVTIVDGAVHIAGNYTANGAARLYKPYAAADFVSVEMDVTISSRNNAKVSVFMSKEKRQGGGAQVQGKIGIARRREGGLVVLAADVSTADENWEDVAEVGGKAWWPLDQPVRLRIERVGEGSESTARLSVDGITVREGIRMQRMSASNNDLRVGIAVEGSTGLPADVVVDNVDVVYKIKR